jgi:peptide/nickel transport system substrate-binding protein
MTGRRRSFTAVAAIGVLAFAVACAPGNAGGGGSTPASSAPAPASDTETFTPPKVTIGTAEDSKGPAPAPEGVVRGGTVTMLDRDDFAHLDPGQIYLNTESNMALLYARGLTGYKRVGPNEYKLVGDLATDPGTPSDGGRTWTFTLKDGVKWQDGSPITSEDVKWTMERLFAPHITYGPAYIQQWLTGEEDYKKAYGGPYGGKRLDSIETPDEKTVVFRFKEPHADANFALAMTGYAIVPKAKDTKEKYDKEPFSSGPYVITSHTPDKSMELERNPHWDPATDPIRGGYPDKWRFEFGQERLQITDRFIADAGEDKTALSFYAWVAPERLQQVLKDENLKSRMLRQPSPYGNYYYFNLDRVKDIKHRQAINIAWPTRQLQQLEGGPAANVISTTILNPVVAGWQDYDVFGMKAKPEGDIERAKQLMAESSDPNPTIVYAYNQTPIEERKTVVIKNQLAKIGINVVPKPLARKTYYDQISKVDNGFDLYWGGWGQDWPSGSTVLPVIFGPVRDGGYNLSHLRDPEIDAEMKRILEMADANEANAAWAALDKRIMETITPIVPDTNDIGTMLYGSRIGGAEIDPQLWTVSPNLIYVKPQ